MNFRYFIYLILYFGNLTFTFASSDKQEINNFKIIDKDKPETKEGFAPEKLDKKCNSIYNEIKDSYKPSAEINVTYRSIALANTSVKNITDKLTRKIAKIKVALMSEYLNAEISYYEESLILFERIFAILSLFKKRPINRVEKIVKNIYKDIGLKHDKKYDTYIFEKYDGPSIISALKEINNELIDIIPRELKEKVDIILKDIKISDLFNRLSSDFVSNLMTKNIS